MRSFIARVNDWLAPAIGRAQETDLGEGACESFIDEICDELDRDAESRDRTRDASSINPTRSPTEQCSGTEFLRPDDAQRRR